MSLLNALCCFCSLVCAAGLRPVTVPKLCLSKVNWVCLAFQLLHWVNNRHGFRDFGSWPWVCCHFFVKGTLQIKPLSNGHAKFELWQWWCRWVFVVQSICPSEHSTSYHLPRSHARVQHILFWTAAATMYCLSVIISQASAIDWEAFWLSSSWLANVVELYRPTMTMQMAVSWLPRFLLTSFNM